MRIKTLNEKTKLDKLRKEEEEILITEIKFTKNTIIDLQEHYKYTQKDKNFKKMNEIKQEIDEETRKLQSLERELSKISQSKENKKNKLKTDIYLINKQIEDLRHKVKKEYKNGNYLKIDELEKEIKHLKNVLHEYSHDYRKIIKENIYDVSKHLKQLQRKFKDVKVIEKFTNNNTKPNGLTAKEYIKLLREIKQAKEILHVFKQEDKKHIEKELRETTKEKKELEEIKKVAVKINDKSKIVFINNNIKNIKARSVKLKKEKVEKINKVIEKSRKEIHKLNKKLELGKKKNWSKLIINKIKEQINNEHENLNNNKRELLKDNNPELKGLFMIQKDIEESKENIKKLKRRLQKNSSVIGKDRLRNEKDVLDKLKEQLSKYLNDTKENLYKKLEVLKESYFKAYAATHFIRADETELEIDSIKNKLEDLTTEDFKHINNEIKNMNKHIKELENERTH
jgi:chromosome segregation ATPase